MPQPDRQPASDLHAAARRVQRRLALRAALRYASVSAVYVCTGVLALIVIAALLGARAQGVGAVVTVVVCAVLAWLIGVAWQAWRQRPGEAEALATWDAAAHRHEAFLSAWCFEQEEPRPALQEGAPAAASAGTHAAEEPIRQLHHRKVIAALPAAMDRLHADLPLHLQHRAWISPLVLLALAFTGWLVPAPTVTQAEVIDADARTRAAAVGQDLAQREDLLASDAALEEEEKKKLEELREALKETAERMEQLEGKSPRELLAELERRAREAEALADALDTGAQGGLSSEMLAELARHADTAELADALRAEDLEDAAGEAEDLADRLESTDITLEEQQRVEDAFDQSLQAGNDQDRDSMVGQRLDASREKLAQRQPREAGKPLRDMAKGMQRQAHRQEAQQRLQQLAQQLRGAGQQVFNRQGDGLQQLQQQGGAQQLARGNQGDMAQALAQQLNRFGQQQPQAGQGQMAQLQHAPQGGGQGQPQAGQMPVPGGMQGQMPGGQPPVPGQMQGGFPLPGQQAGAQPGGQIPGGGQQGAGAGPMIPGGNGAGAGQGPPGGAASQPGQGGGQGGLSAGNAAADLGENTTDPLTSSGTGVVNAQSNNAGQSSVRTIQGPGQREGAARESRDLALDFIQAQEDALADEAIPLARRDQIIRYFQALRTHLEQP